MTAGMTARQTYSWTSSREAQRDGSPRRYLASVERAAEGGNDADTVLSGREGTPE